MDRRTFIGCLVAGVATETLEGDSGEDLQDGAGAERLAGVVVPALRGFGRRVGVRKELGLTMSASHKPTLVLLGVFLCWSAQSIAQEQPSSDRCKFISPKGALGIIAADLDAQSGARAKRTRYLTFTHLASLCTRDNVLEVYRQGAVKLLNGLSRSTETVKAQSIDPAGSILRIDIEQLGWDASDWETLVADYPYVLRPDSQLNAVLDDRTGTKIAFIRADWFAFAASRSSLYEKVLKLPKTLQELATAQGVNIDNNVKRFAAQRLGVSKRALDAINDSDVRTQNRVLERHPSANGYFWTTYDFSGNRANQNVFEFPLGPGGSNGFVHNASQTIFSLPNGFQGYFLSDAKGNTLSKGPTEIYRDPGFGLADPLDDPSSVNAISCMRCHYDGIRQARDQLRISIINSRNQSRAVREQVESLYPPVERMDRLLSADASRFTEAMRRAGLDPNLKYKGAEPTFALSTYYQQPLDLNKVAIELGVTKENFVQLANDERPLGLILRRFNNNLLLPRDEFESSFKELAKLVD